MWSEERLEVVRVLNVRSLGVFKRRLIFGKSWMRQTTQESGCIPNS